MSDEQEQDITISVTVRRRADGGYNSTVRTGASSGAEAAAALTALASIVVTDAVNCGCIACQRNLPALTEAKRVLDAAI